MADIQNLKANRILDVSGRFGSIASLMEVFTGWRRLLPDRSETPVSDKPR